MFSAEELDGSRVGVGLVAGPDGGHWRPDRHGPLSVAFGGSRYAWIPLLVDAVTIALVWLAVGVSTRLTRPWLVRASAAANLRTT